MYTTLDLTKIKSPGSELSCVYREMFQIDQKDRYGGKVELYPEIHLDTVEITRRQDEKTISIFSGKITTCVEAAKETQKIIQNK